MATGRGGFSTRPQSKATRRYTGFRHDLWRLRAYPEYSVAKEDRLGRSGAAPVHLSGFIRCTVRQLFG